jgi:hypothetical protein
MHMYRIPQSGLILFSVAALMAADASWKTKPLAQWSEEDAKQVLSNSPWVKRVTPAQLSGRNERERRDGGQMGGGKPANLDEINLGSFFGAGARPARKKKDGPFATLTLRWESALPVRTAEGKVREADAPALEDGSYAVAVYGIPSESISGNVKSLAETLKKTSMLKRGNKKNLKPSRVQIIEGDDNSVIVYFFPRSAGITADDLRVEFDAQIGQYFVAQPFATAEMQVQGKLEL